MCRIASNQREPSLALTRTDSLPNTISHAPTLYQESMSNTPVGAHYSYSCDLPVAALAALPSHVLIVQCAHPPPQCVPELHYYAQTFHISVASQHALHQLSQWSVPLSLLISLLVCQAKFLHEKHVMLEPSVQVCFQAQAPDHGVVVAIYVRVYPIQALENGANGLLKVRGKRNTGVGWKDGAVREVI